MKEKAKGRYFLIAKPKISSEHRTPRFCVKQVAECSLGENGMKNSSSPLQFEFDIKTFMLK